MVGSYYTFKRNLTTTLRSATTEAEREGRSMAKASFTRPVKGALGDAISIKYETWRPQKETVYFGIIRRRGTFKYTSDYWSYVEFGARHGHTVRGFFIPKGGTPYTGQIFIPVKSGTPFKMLAPTPARRFLRNTLQIFQRKLQPPQLGKAPPSVVKMANTVPRLIRRAVVSSYRGLESKYRG